LRGLSKQIINIFISIGTSKLPTSTDAANVRLDDHGKGGPFEIGHHIAQSAGHAGRGGGRVDLDCFGYKNGLSVVWHTIQHCWVDPGIGEAKKGVGAGKMGREMLTTRPALGPRRALASCSRRRGSQGLAALDCWLGTPQKCSSKPSVHGVPISRSAVKFLMNS
jgi:hypothetical protein